MSGSVDRVAVLGAGTMGHGIAQVAAAAGCATVLYDIDSALVEAGLARIRANLDTGVDRGKVSSEARAGALERLSGSADLGAAVGDADLVVEAVPEDAGLKIDVLRRAADAAPEHVILATNTSSIRIGTLARELPRPSRVVGMHFFNPVHVMELLEVVRGDESDDAVVDAAVALGRAMGKTPIVVRDSPGFASSRLGLALGLEAMRMLEEGVADADAIDTAMALGYRHPMGPLRLTDLVGLDVRLAIADYLHGELSSEVFRPPEILRRLVREGHLGKKSGEGFYRW